jgi:AraC-like DNA-binding protein
MPFDRLPLMKFERYVPRGRLSRHIRFLWASEQPPQPHSQERLLPTGEMGLFVDVSDTSSSPPILAGASSRPRVLNTGQSISMLGVSFAPGGASSFFRTPVSEIANLTVPLDEFCGGSALTLRAEILEAATNSVRFRVLERYLEALLAAADTPGHPAVRQALGELRSVSEVRIADLAGRMGIGQRRFIELFRREVGLTPKLYQRVARFQQVLVSIENHRDTVWADVASLHGYFDQAHLIHDFNTFAGVSPSVYLQRRSSRNHVALPVSSDGNFLQSSARRFRHDTPP